MTARRRKRRSPEQIVRKLRDADTMFNAGKDESVVLRALEIRQSKLGRRLQYGGMKAAEAKRLKEMEIENRWLKQLGPRSANA